MPVVLSPIEIRVLGALMEKEENVQKSRGGLELFK